MPEVGKTLLGFDKEVALEFILDIEYTELRAVVPMLMGPWGGFLGFFVKIVLRWQIFYTAWGIKRVEVTISSFLKNRDYLNIREEIQSKGELTDAQKKDLFKRYVPIARNALTV